MILASASPRRLELLQRAGFQPTVCPADIDETRMSGESPLLLVERLATEKARAALDAHGSLENQEVLIAADTIVWTGEDVLGKPRDEADARRMLAELSGKTHHVSTGVCLLMGRTGAHPYERSFVETTDVTFKELSSDQIADYVATGEPMDKAGAYGIQGGAHAFVNDLTGDYDNVVGLPVTRLLAELARAAGTSHINSVTQIPGIFAAHATNEPAGTGCTVIICPEGATGAVDVRGGAPATRETDLLRPEETVQNLHAVVLSGGSAYGLAASCGVANALEQAHIGLDVGVGIVPIVSGACLFDLAVGDAHVRPDVTDGANAAIEALKLVDVAPALRPALAQGNVGAGTGCSVGKLRGPQHAMKAGLGEDVEQAGSLVCGAVAAVNACGNVVDPHDGTPIAGVLADDAHTILSAEDALLSQMGAMPLDIAPRTNTTISCVVTNARLTQAEATKVAQMAADAYAHSIRPVHTSNDGDTVFVIATGAVEAPVDVVAVLATRALEHAIVNAATHATSAYGLKAACDL